MTAWSIGPHQVQLFLGEPQLPVIYLLGEAGQGESVWPLLDSCCTLVEVSGFDWNRDLSPWPAPRVFAKGDDFSGGADGFLHQLLSEILPKTEAALPFPVADRGLAGYSLAGLFSLYALTRTDRFCRAGSFSGSLWYDGFVTYLQNQPRPVGAKIALSLGDRERRSRNGRMAQVQDCTQQVLYLLQTKNTVTFQLHAGGHFSQVPQRIAQGIRQLAAL